MGGKESAEKFLVAVVRAQGLNRTCPLHKAAQAAESLNARGGGAFRSTTSSGSHGDAYTI